MEKGTNKHKHNLRYFISMAGNGGYTMNKWESTIIIIIIGKHTTKGKKAIKTAWV